MPSSRTDTVDSAVALSARPDGDRRSRRRELDGVREQVEEDLLELGQVGLDLRKAGRDFDDELRVLRRTSRA